MKAELNRSYDFIIIGEDKNPLNNQPKGGEQCQLGVQTVGGRLQ